MTMPAATITAEVDAMPGRMRTLAGFLDDADRIPTLRPITTRAVRLNPDLWPSAAEELAQGESA